MVDLKIKLLHKALTVNSIKKQILSYFESTTVEACKVPF
jgi:hypothetical protein